LSIAGSNLHLQAVLICFDFAAPSTLDYQSHIVFVFLLEATKAVTRKCFWIQAIQIQVLAGIITLLVVCLGQLFTS
jgi:hypothetical protein